MDGWRPSVPQKGEAKQFPYLNRQVPMTWHTSNGSFQTKGEGSIQLKFFEYSNSIWVKIKPDVVAYDGVKMKKQLFDLILFFFWIGWVEFLHGKIPLSLTTFQGNYCTSYKSHQGMTGRSWAWVFIYQLLQISHSQWLFRNFTLHHRTQGYLATKARLEILDKISDLADV